MMYLKEMINHSSFRLKGISLARRTT